MLLRTLLKMLIVPLVLSPFAASGLELKDVIYNPPGGGTVVFSHARHLRQEKMKKDCSACHDRIFNMRQKNPATMADMEKGKSCGACHDGKKAFGLAACSRCHSVTEVKMRTPETGPVRFGHRAHAAANRCDTCHPRLFPTDRRTRTTMAQMKAGKSCGACHNGKKAFSIDKCETCHPVKEIVWKVAQTGPTRFSHRTHIAEIGCQSCHPKLYKAGRGNATVGMAAMEKGKSCGACHNGKTAFAIDKCTRCHPTKDVTYPVKEAGPVLFPHAPHVSMYGCGECHPKLFPFRGAKPATMGDMEKGKSCGACHDGKTAFTTSGDCGKCHKM